jgi:hypothetical protein
MKALGGSDKVIGPWSGEDAVRSAAAVVIGVAVLIFAWVNASEQVSPSSQVNWISWSVVGLALAVYGQILWLYRGRTLIRQRSRHMFQRQQASTPETHAVRVATYSAGTFVAALGLSFYHKPSCIMVADDHNVSGDAEFHQRASRTACGICRP